MEQNKKSRFQDRNLIIVTDPEGNIREVSQAFLQRSGHDQQSLTSQPLQALCHPDMPEGPVKDLWGTIGRGQPWMGMLQLASRDGSPLWLDAYVIPVIEQGKLVECQCIFRLPSQETTARAATIYQLRRQGRVPPALRRPRPDLRGRLWLAQGFSLLPTVLAAFLQPESALLLFIALGGTSILLLLTTAWLCAPLRTLVRYSRTLVDHPIKQLIYTGTHNDIGQLQLSLQMLQSQLDSVLIRMQHASGEVLAGAQQSIGVMTRTCEEIEEQQSALIQLATAMNQISATIQDMSTSTASTAEQTQAMQASAGEGQQVVDAAVGSIRQLASSIADTTSTVAALQQQSQNIGSIVNVIRDIAEQTNLLALNAAIEAARAGENGRGFAVVADEVRQLAQRTQQSTGEIQQLIDALQQQTTAIVSAMDAKQALSGQTVEQIEGAGEVLTRILSSIDLINDMATQIAGASEEQSSVVHEVSQKIERLSAGAERTVADAALTLELNTGAVRLAERQRYLVDCIMRS